MVHAVGLSCRIWSEVDFRDLFGSFCWQMIFSVFKSISMDRCFFISRNAAPNILQYPNVYSYRLVSNFSRSWSYLEAVGYIFIFLGEGWGEKDCTDKATLFVCSFIKMLSTNYFAIFVPLPLNESSCTSTSVYECPKPETAKNEEIKFNIFL